MLIKGKDLTSLLLKPDATLQDAIVKMNKTKFKIIFIVEKKNFFRESYLMEILEELLQRERSFQIKFLNILIKTQLV